MCCGCDCCIEHFIAIFLVKLGWWTPSTDEETNIHIKYGGDPRLRVETLTKRQFWYLLLAFLSVPAASALLYFYAFDSGSDVAEFCSQQIINTNQIVSTNDSITSDKCMNEDGNDLVWRQHIKLLNVYETNITVKIRLLGLDGGFINETLWNISLHYTDGGSSGVDLRATKFVTAESCEITKPPDKTDCQVAQIDIPAQFLSQLRYTVEGSHLLVRLYSVNGTNIASNGTAVFLLFRGFKFSGLNFGLRTATLFGSLVICGWYAYCAWRRYYLSTQGLVLTPLLPEQRGVIVLLLFLALYSNPLYIPTRLLQPSAGSSLGLAFIFFEKDIANLFENAMLAYLSYMLYCIQHPQTSGRQAWQIPALYCCLGWWLTTSALYLYGVFDIGLVQQWSHDTEVSDSEFTFANFVIWIYSIIHWSWYLRLLWQLYFARKVVKSYPYLSHRPRALLYLLFLLIVLPTLVATLVIFAVFFFTSWDNLAVVGTGFDAPTNRLIRLVVYSVVATIFGYLLSPILMPLNDDVEGHSADPPPPADRSWVAVRWYRKWTKCTRELGGTGMYFFHTEYECAKFRDAQQRRLTKSPNLSPEGKSWNTSQTQFSKVSKQQQESHGSTVGSSVLFDPHKSTIFDGADNVDNGSFRDPANIHLFCMETAVNMLNLSAQAYRDPGTRATVLKGTQTSSEKKKRKPMKVPKHPQDGSAPSRVDRVLCSPCLPGGEDDGWDSSDEQHHGLDDEEDDECRARNGSLNTAQYGYTLFKCFQVDGLQCIVSHITTPPPQGACIAPVIVSFRGTSNLKNVVSDVKLFHVEIDKHLNKTRESQQHYKNFCESCCLHCPCKCYTANEDIRNSVRVHGGFYNAYMLMRPDVKAAVTEAVAIVDNMLMCLSTTCEAEFKCSNISNDAIGTTTTTTSTTPNKGTQRLSTRSITQQDRKLSKIMTCGHSLGGALATLAAYDFVTTMNIATRSYTFGSPRVGNYAFYKLYTRAVPDTYRIVNESDVVPTVPKGWMGFKHVGVSVRIDRKGNFIIEPTQIERMLAPWSGRRFASHMMKSYEESINSVCRYFDLPLTCRLPVNIDDEWEFDSGFEDEVEAEVGPAEARSLLSPQ